MTEVPVEGSLAETYHAAVQHDLVDLPDDATLVGVVRRPTAWFAGAIDENVPALAPPEPLLDETKDAQERLARDGLCDEEAHNAAWAETDFERRYLAHLDTDPDAEAAMVALCDLVAAGEAVVLVCYEGEDKRCHRHLLLEGLRDRLADRPD